MNTIDKIRENINKVTLDATFKAQQKYGFEIGTGPHSTWNNEADAFKHAYMQWYLSYYHGIPTAKLLGDFHEFETWNGPKNERNMDFWNNSVGREIAQKMKKIPELINKSPEEISNIASRIIYEKMKNGELITSPDDMRKFNFFTGKREPAPEQQPPQNSISNPNKKAERIRPYRITGTPNIVSCAIKKRKKYPVFRLIICRIISICFRSIPIRH